MSGSVTMPLTEYDELKKLESEFLILKEKCRHASKYETFYNKFKNEKLKRIDINIFMNSNFDTGRFRVMTEEDILINDIHGIFHASVFSNDKELEERIRKEILNIRSEIYEKIRQSDKWYKRLF